MTNSRNFFLVISFFLISSAAKFFGVIINTSSSMPIGIYIKKFSAIQRGDIVAVCLDAASTRLGLQQRYLKAGFHCQGSRPLIKKIIAVPDDQITLTDDYLAVNHQFYFYPTFYRDSRGKALLVFPRGNYQSTKNYWLLGTLDPHSWDSRYWGPVFRENIIENLHPWLIWN